MTQSYISYQLVTNVNFAGGFFYATGVGARPSIAVQLIKRIKNVFLVVVPRMDVYQTPAFEIMTVIEARTPLSNKFNFYARINAMSNYGKHAHNRSFQNFVIGIERKSTQFGLAATFDEYGESKLTRFNAGVFIKRDLP